MFTYTVRTEQYFAHKQVPQQQQVNSYFSDYLQKVVFAYIDRAAVFNMNGCCSFSSDSSGKSFDKGE